MITKLKNTVEKCQAERPPWNKELYSCSKSFKVMRDLAVLEKSCRYIAGYCERKVFREQLNFSSKLNLSQLVGVVEATWAGIKTKLNNVIIERALVLSYNTKHTHSFKICSDWGSRDRFLCGIRGSHCTDRMHVKVMEIRHSINRNYSGGQV